MALSKVFLSPVAVVAILAVPSWMSSQKLLDIASGGGIGWEDVALLSTGVICIVLMFVLRRTFLVASGIATREGRPCDNQQVDPMTGLGDATQFQDRVTVTLTQGASAAVLFVDLVRFGEVNTRRGRAFGDAVIKEVGHRIRAIAEGVGGFVARLDGDKFAILLTSDQKGSLDKFCEHVAASCAAPVTKGGESIVPHIRIGAVDPAHAGDAAGNDFDEVYRRGKVALIAARESGDPYRIYEPSLDNRFIDRTAMMEELPDALRAGGLDVFFQPRVNLTDGSIFGFEALVRWPRGNSYVPAAELIAMAEETGIVIDLDRYMMDRAVEIIADWNRRRKTAFAVCVNLSPLHFRTDQGVDFVADCLARHQFSPNLLTVEFTETVDLDTCKNFLTSLARLKDTGCRIAIDDFGSGYAPLTHLRALPADEVNIERLLLAEADQSEKARVILAAVLDLAENLGLDVMSGGIERESQAKLLVDLGCEKGQGYLFGHPRPALDWLEDVTYSRMPTVPAA